MADKMDWDDAMVKARELLQGKKTKGSNFMKLASALSKGKAAQRNEILGRYAVANGLPAAAAVAAGVAVADKVANNKTAKKNKPKNNKTTKITEANRKAAKEAMNAAFKESTLSKKAGVAQAGRYAKLLKEGKENNAQVYLETIIETAAERGAEAAAKAALKAATKNVKAIAKANKAKNTTVKITSANRKNAKKALNAALIASDSTRKAGAAQAGRYAKLLKEGKANNAQAYLDDLIGMGATVAEKAKNKTVKITSANRKDAKKALNAALVASASSKKAGVAQAGHYAKLLKEGKANNAKAYMDELIAVAAKKEGKKAPAAALPTIAEKKNMATNTRNLELLMGPVVPRKRPASI